MSENQTHSDHDLIVRLDTKVDMLVDEMRKFSDIPRLITVHDERIKNLETENTKRDDRYSKAFWFSLSSLVTIGLFLIGLAVKVFVGA